jgi:hypothetical protein
MERGVPSWKRKINCLRSTLAAEPPDKELNGARLGLAELRAIWLGRGDGIGAALASSQ